MENTIKSFTTEQLIAELKTRNYRTDLIFGLDDIASVVSAWDDEMEITDRKLIKILKSVNTDNAWEVLTESIFEQVS